MSFLKKIIGKYPVGIWLAFLALTFISLAWIMQIYSLLDWEGAIKLGIQNNSFAGDKAERTLADVERGVAIADLLWPLPLTIIAFVGLIRKSIIGFVAALMTFAVCIYFPLFYSFRESTNTEIMFVVIFLWAIPSLLGITGLWSNRKLFISKL